MQMNLMNVGTTKDGRPVITFGKSPESLALFSSMVTQLLAAVSAHIASSTPHTLPTLKAAAPPPSSTTDIRAAKRGRSSDAVVKMPKPPMTEYQVAWERQREEINQRIVIVGNRDFRGTTSEEKFTSAWHFAYYLLEKQTGYRAVERATMTYGNHGNSLINRVLKDGKGDDLISILDRYLGTADQPRIKNLNLSAKG